MFLYSSDVDFTGILTASSCGFYLDIVLPYRYYYQYSQASFQYAVKSLGNTLILSGLVFLLCFVFKFLQ